MSSAVTLQADPTIVSDPNGSTATTLDDNSDSDDSDEAAISPNLFGVPASTHEIVEVFCAAWRKRDAGASEMEKKNEALEEKNEMLGKKNEALEKQLEEMRERLQEKDEKLGQNSIQLQQREEELEDQQEQVRALKCCIADKNEEVVGKRPTTTDRGTQTD